MDLTLSLEYKVAIHPSCLHFGCSFRVVIWEIFSIFQQNKSWPSWNLRWCDKYLNDILPGTAANPNIPTFSWRSPEKLKEWWTLAIIVLGIHFVNTYFAKFIQQKIKLGKKISMLIASQTDFLFCSSTTR